MTTRRGSPTGTREKHVAVFPARTPLLHVGYAVFEPTGCSRLDYGEALPGQFAALVPKLDAPGAGNELPIVVEAVIGVALLADGFGGDILFPKKGFGRARLAQSLLGAFVDDGDRHLGGVRRADDVVAEPEPHPRPRRNGPGHFAVLDIGQRPDVSAGRARRLGPLGRLGLVDSVFDDLDAIDPSGLRMRADRRQR